jgi:hypothetical protein
VSHNTTAKGHDLLHHLLVAIRGNKEPLPENQTNTITSNNLVQAFGLQHTTHWEINLLQAGFFIHIQDLPTCTTVYIKTAIVKLQGKVISCQFIKKKALKNWKKMAKLYKLCGSMVYQKSHKVIHPVCSLRKKKSSAWLAVWHHTWHL